MKRVISIMLCALMLVSFVACADDKETSNGGSSSNNGVQTPTANAKVPDIIRGTMDIVDWGMITFELYYINAPDEVANFIHLVKKGFFDSVMIDQVQKGALVQMGRYKTGFVANENPFGEYKLNNEHKIGISAGTMCWASGDTSEFFISADTASTYNLRETSAAFGQVVDGLDVIKSIAEVNTNGLIPTETITVRTITVDLDLNDDGVDDFVVPEPKFIRSSSAT